MAHRPPPTGSVVVLNGAPRAGKSSLARAVLAAAVEPWVNLGVDAALGTTPGRLLPGIGLRPGGERPDLEPFVRQQYRALFDSIAAHSRAGINVAADLGIHDGYRRPLGIWRLAAERLADHPVHVVGVRCPIEVVLARRAARPIGAHGRYDVAGADGRTPDAVERWQRAVHDPGWYDLEIDTSRIEPAEGAARVSALLSAHDRPRALARHLVPADDGA